MGAGFGALREVVLGNPAAQARLRGTRDWEDFVVTAEEVAAEHGIDITRRDLDDARADAHRDRADRGV